MNPLQKLAAIADAYENSALDEMRPEWQHLNPTSLKNVIMIEGHGGKELLTLQDCLDAREWLKEFKEVAENMWKF